MQLLLGNGGYETHEALRSAAGIETYVMLALEYARPQNAGAIPAEKIIECREHLAEELTAFRNYVTAQHAELAQLAAIPVERRRLEAFAEHVQHSIEQPLRKLEKGMQLHKLEPTRSLLLAGSLAPPAAVGAGLAAAGTPPAIATAAGALVAAGSAWWQVESIRTRSKAESPVGYLLDVRDQLTPKSLWSQVLKVFRGTYGHG